MEIRFETPRRRASSSSGRRSWNGSRATCSTWTSSRTLSRSDEESAWILAARRRRGCRLRRRPALVDRRQPVCDGARAARAPATRSRQQALRGAVGARAPDSGRTRSGAGSSRTMPSRGASPSTADSGRSGASTRSCSTWPTADVSADAPSRRRARVARRAPGPRAGRLRGRLRGRAPTSPGHEGDDFEPHDRSSAGASRTSRVPARCRRR